MNKKKHLHAISYNLQLMKIKFISVIEPRALECKLWQLSCCTWTYSHATRTGLNCVVDRKPKTVGFFYKHKSVGKNYIVDTRLVSYYLGTFWKLNIVHLIYIKIISSVKSQGFFCCTWNDSFIYEINRLVSFTKKTYFWKILHLGYRICF